MNSEHYELCMNVLNKLREDEGNYQYFNAPAVSALPEEERNKYLRQIDKPMDLELVRRNLIEQNYSAIAEFQEDVDLVFDNSKKYCKSIYPAVYDIADKFQKYFRGLMDKSLTKLPKKTKDSRKSTDSGVESKGLSTSTSSSKSKRGRDSLPPINEEPQLSGEGLISKCEKLVTDIMNLNDASKMLQTPVDLSAYTDYKDRVRNPIDFNLILDRIKDKARVPPKGYSSLNLLALDIRRAFGNFIRYNYYISAAKLRKQAINGLLKFEQMWKDIQKFVYSTSPFVKFQQPLPDVISCLEAIDETFKTPSTVMKNEFAIEGFMYPVEFSFGAMPDELARYRKTISRAMDFSTIISNLAEAEYSHIDQVKEDVRLIASNCKIYWTAYGGEAEKVYIKNAAALEDAFMRSLEERLKKNQPLQLYIHVPPAIATIEPAETLPSKATTGSSKVKQRPSLSSDAFASLSSSTDLSALPISKRQVSSSNLSTSSGPTISIPSIKEETTPSVKKRALKYLNELFRRCLEEVKNHYLLSATNNKLKVYTATPFLKAVDPVKFPDYAQIIHNPMDMHRMEKKLASGRYTSIGSILEDMQLIRDNAYAYNTDKDSIEVPIMADALLAYFKYLIRSAVLDLYLSTDENLANEVVDDVAQALMKESDAEAVTKYVSYVEAETGSKPRFHVNVNSAQTPASVPLPSVKRGRESISNQPIPIQEQQIETKQDDLLDLDMYDDTSLVFAIIPKSGKSGRASKGSKGSSSVVQGIGFQQMPLMQSTPVREKLPWEIACGEMLKKLCNHPYLNIDEKNKSLVANFHIPAAEEYPQSAEEDFKVKNPMDLTTLRMRLDNFSILDAEDFYNMAVGIFQHALDNNKRHQSELEKTMDMLGTDMDFYKYRTLKYEYLVQYTKWLGLEMPREIALTNDIGHAQPEKFGNLRYSLQDAARKDRETYLKTAVIDRSINVTASGLSECDKLLKALKKWSNSAEKLQIDHFLLPFDETLLADYFVYVRKPMDLATIKYKLDGTLPSLGNKPDEIAVKNKIQQAKFYYLFGEFIDDLRRVFDNAIKYNGSHLESDPTGYSEKVYKAAIFMKEKLERILPDYTLPLVDRLERLRLKRLEENDKAERKRSNDEKIEKDVAEFEQQEKEKLLAEDIYYAADLDTERKKALTKEQLTASRLAKRQQIEESWQRKLDSDDDAMDIDESDINPYESFAGSSALAKGSFLDSGVGLDGDHSTLTAYQAHLLEEQRFKRLKDVLRMPLQFVKVLDLKRKLFDIAWQYWEPYARAKEGKPHASRQSHSGPSLAESARAIETKPENHDQSYGLDMKADPSDTSKVIETSANAPQENALLMDNADHMDISTTEINEANSSSQQISGWIEITADDSNGTSLNVPTIRMTIPITSAKHVKSLKKRLVVRPSVFSMEEDDL